MHDSQLERAMVSIAHALYVNRLHVLRLTEVVRLRVRPDSETDGTMTLPDSLDEEMRRLAFDYVVTYLPDFEPAIRAAHSTWFHPA